MPTSKVVDGCSPSTGSRVGGLVVAGPAVGCTLWSDVHACVRVLMCLCAGEEEADAEAAGLGMMKKKKEKEQEQEQEDEGEQEPERERVL